MRVYIFSLRNKGQVSGAQHRLGDERETEEACGSFRCEPLSHPVLCVSRSRHEKMSWIRGFSGTADQRRPSVSSGVFAHIKDTYVRRKKNTLKHSFFFFSFFCSLSLFMPSLCLAQVPTHFHNGKLSANLFLCQFGVEGSCLLCLSK